mgnify:CR=1 FL=1
MRKTELLTANKSKRGNVFGCRDILFGIINDNLNSLEPIVHGFVKEAETLNLLVYTMKTTERDSMTSRGYIAMEYSNLLKSEIANKLHFFESVLKNHQILTHSGMSRLHFM